MKYLLTALVCMMTISLHAEDIDGVFITYSGSKACYKFTDVPKITFSSDKKTAYVTLNGSLLPVLAIPLDKENAMKIVFGTYSTTSIKEVVSIEQRGNRKYISGGQLIIVKDGKKYDVNGREIK